MGKGDGYMNSVDNTTSKVLTIVITKGPYVSQAVEMGDAQEFQRSFLVVLGTHLRLQDVDFFLSRFLYTARSER